MSVKNITGRLMGAAAALMIFSGAMTSCVDDSDGNQGGLAPDAPITLSVTTLNFSADGGNATVDVNAPYVWSAVQSNPWIGLRTINTLSTRGIIDVTIGPNDTPEARTGEIVVKSNKVSATITVNQAAGSALPPIGD